MQIMGIEIPAWRAAVALAITGLFIGIGSRLAQYVVDWAMNKWIMNYISKTYSFVAEMTIKEKYQFIKSTIKQKLLEEKK